MSRMTVKVSKGANIGNRYNQVPNLTQDTNGKVTNLQFDTTICTRTVQHDKWFSKWMGFALGPVKNVSI